MRNAILVAVGVSALILSAGTGRLGAQEAVTVDIQDFSFQPHELRVNVGTAVRWVNRDSEVPHQVAAEDGKTVSSPLIQPGKDFMFTFAQAGQVSYRCAVHPTMFGVITVTGP